MNRWERWGHSILLLVTLAAVLFGIARQEGRMSETPESNRLRATWTQHGVTFERTIEWSAESDQRIPALALCNAIRTAKEAVETDVKARGPLVDPARK